MLWRGIVIRLGLGFSHPMVILFGKHWSTYIDGPYRVTVHRYRDKLWLTKVERW